MQDPRQVARGLEEIAALLRFAEQPKFKVQSYERGAQVVESLGAELGPLVEQDRLRELPGIGPSLSKQIHELWNTGSSEYLSQLRSAHPPGAVELVRVPGLTPRRIRALAELGVGSVDALVEACRAGRVRGLAGFGEKTEQRLLAAAERYLGTARGRAEPMLLARALELASVVERALHEVTPHVYLTGALRRGEETVTELEFLVGTDPEPLLAALAPLRQVLRIDRSQCSAQLADGLRLVLHPLRAGLGNAWVFSTGSQSHVDRVLERARGAGIELARPDPGEPNPPGRSFPTEAALYGALGAAFVPPELRTGDDELERAARGELDQLLELGDLRGLVHCHTTYSDGKNSIEEMALAAQALGMQYITITDHSPSAHYAGGVTLDRLKAQWDEIAAVQERVPIRILRGTESDILSDGSLDFPDAVLERFDVVIASIHARHRMDRETMTRRLTRALSLPMFKIWGHALGRILNHRDPIDCDVPAVLDALAGSRGAVEINADPHRLDLPPSWIPSARERGLPFVVSVDAHSTQGLRVLPYGVTMARRGGLTKAEVLNTADAEAFAARVRPV